MNWRSISVDSWWFILPMYVAMYALYSLGAFDREPSAAAQLRAHISTVSYGGTTTVDSPLITMSYDGHVLRATVQGDGIFKNSFN